tara:strand:+ start:882 stop:2048 length:1167 start_codon:yes stop_codon:yes gene_type:complete
VNFFKIKKNKIPFGKPLIDGNEIKSVMNVLKSGIYAHGPISSLFEKKFCLFTGAKYSTTVSSCTAGMHLFYFALGIGKGDEVIVPAQTHTATAHAVELVGAKPIFVDCEINTGNIDPSKIEKKISKKTKAICVVHFLGVPVDMEKINLIAKKYKLFVLEDCALSLGASFNKIHTGLLGDAGVFSFYPAKHITTGEGGVLITKNKKLFNRIKLLKSLGINKTFLERKTPGIYDVTEVGFNYRMSEIHASIGVKQIEKINNFIKKRKKNFNFLKKNLQLNKHLYILDSANQKFKNSFYCMNVVLSKKLSKNRMRIIKYLNKRNIGTSIYYPQPVPRMSFYKKKYGYKQSDFLNSSIISDRSISLPVGPHLSLSDLRYISKNLLASVKKFQ